MPEFEQCDSNSNSAFERIFRKTLIVHADALERQFEMDRYLMHFIGDIGSLTMVAVMIARAETLGGATSLADVETFVAPRGIATPRRVRAFVEWLDHRRGLEWPATNGGRRRPFRLTGWTIDLLRSMSAVAHGSVEALRPDAARPGPDPNRLLAALAGSVCHALTARESLPPALATLFNRRGGYLLLARLIGQAERGADGKLTSTLSRKTLAKRYGLSRAHVTLMLVTLEKLGCVTRQNGNAVLVDEAFDNLSRSIFSKFFMAILAAGCESPQAKDHSVSNG